MIHKRRVITSVATAIILLGAVPLLATADEALDQAIAALKTYDWGSDRAVLAPIDKAVAASHEDSMAQRELAKRLTAVLTDDVSGAAKDYVCRKLSLVGSSGCVNTVAALLTDDKLSHMARYALERIPDDAAVAAMRDALPSVSGRLKVGVINSLGVRRDASSVPALVELLGASDNQVVAAASMALGTIGNSDAAKALGAFRGKAPESLRLAAADACLACAERLLADDKKSEAMAIYMSLTKPDQPKHVQLAAKRGLLAAAAKK